jgi:hypothetical protein
MQRRPLINSNAVEELERLNFKPLRPSSENVVLRLQNRRRGLSISDSVDSSVEQLPS